MNWKVGAGLLVAGLVAGAVLQGRYAQRARARLTAERDSLMQQVDSLTAHVAKSDTVYRVQYVHLAAGRDSARASTDSALGELDSLLRICTDGSGSAAAASVKVIGELRQNLSDERHKSDSLTALAAARADSLKVVDSLRVREVYQMRSLLDACLRTPAREPFLGLGGAAGVDIHGKANAVVGVVVRVPVRIPLLSP